MKVLLIVALGLVAFVSARPSNDIIDFETDHMEHEQEGQAGRAVEGEYSWVAPDGNEYVVKYVADHLGYRVVEDNVLPRAVEVVPAEEAEEEEGEEEEAEEEEAAVRAIEEEEAEEEEEEEE
ncbi:larval cuticle protein 16/17-like [Palaemon carinicauda]|uniref:larval cuticle protein 16/17-like n=1 Tax=Palaemon carinicauda TaxID=392227 RepID=UPI0035B5927C